MIVADASLVVELVLNRGEPAGVTLRGHIGHGEEICAPHLLDAEVGQALRRLVLRRQSTVRRASASLDLLAALPIRRFAHGWLLSRAFEFRDNATVYDGLYLALAEALDAPLLTCDTKLREVPGCSANVEVLPVTPAGRGG